MNKSIITVEVFSNGAVTVAYGTGIRAMSRFSANAQVIAGILPAGTHQYVPDLFTAFGDESLSSLGIIIRDIVSDM